MWCEVVPTRSSIMVASGLLLGCTSDVPVAGDWAGTFRDSAGVVIVDNPQEGVWTPNAQWQLEEDLRIGVVEGDAVRQFESIDDIAIDGSSRIYVLDGSAIRVFEGNGEFVRTIGRSGGGPGELARPSAILIGTGDTIYVPDTRNGRVQRFLIDGTDAGAFPIAMSPGISLAWRIRPDGALIQEVRTLPTASTDAERILLQERGGDGAVLDTLVEMPVGEAMVIQNGAPEMTLFGPEPMWAVLTDGRIATGRSSEYRLEVRSVQGRLERIVQRPFEPRTFSDSDQREFRAQLQEALASQPPSPATDRMLQSLKYADHYPAFAELFGGPKGTIWVRHAKDVSAMDRVDLEALDVRSVGASSYDVFDRAGRYLGVVAVPDWFDPLRSVGGHVYGVGRDDLGVQYVVRLRVIG